MQRANRAYDKNNLLQLLELQLELEHIDQSANNNISEDRLKHYNKILKEQLVELEQEILHLEGGFKAQFDIALFVDVSPATLMHDLAVEIVGVRHAIRDLEHDLLAFADIKNIKVWLKDIQRRSRLPVSRRNSRSRLMKPRRPRLYSESSQSSGVAARGTTIDGRLRHFLHYFHFA